jgi:PilZ domain
MKTRSRDILRDRRIEQRHKVKTTLRVRVWKSGQPEKRGQSVNLSQRGIFFVTDSVLGKDDIVEILLQMPKEITGEPTTEWRCTGHVVRVEPVVSPKGRVGVGVQFYCYDVSRPEQAALPISAGLPRHMPVHCSH